MNDQTSLLAQIFVTLFHCGKRSKSFQ